MTKKPALILAALCVLSIAVLYTLNLSNKQAGQAEPAEGRACFQLHLGVLPPGTQYEGAKRINNKIRVKVMTGVDLREIECRLAPDGTLLPALGQ